MKKIKHEITDCTAFSVKCLLSCQNSPPKVYGILTFLYDDGADNTAVDTNTHKMTCTLRLL